MFPGFSTSALFNCGLNNSLFWGVVLQVGECTMVFLTLLHKMLTVSPLPPVMRIKMSSEFVETRGGGGACEDFPCL